MKAGNKLLTALLLLAALVLVNYLASKLPLRADMTAENVYTLSPGTEALLGKLSEPVQFDFYFSKSVAGLPPGAKNHAERVLGMLRAYARASEGRIRLNVISPAPDSPEEEKATAAGLVGQPVSTGDRVFFGLVATQADQRQIIPFFLTDRESFLEYDVSQLLYHVENFERRKLGLLTRLPLMSDAPPMMGQRGQEGQYVVTEWEKNFEVIAVDANATELPAGLDLLAIVHPPSTLSPGLLFAIDQFLLGGKPVLAAVDPSSQYFKQQNRNPMFAMQNPDVASDLATLFQGWGIAYDKSVLVGDLDNAALLRVPPSGAEQRFATWINLREAAIDRSAPLVGSVNSLLLVDAGTVGVKEGTGLTFIPLVQTSANAGLIPAASLAFSPPEEAGRQVVAGGKPLTLAGLARGKFKSAYPNGRPAPEKKEEGNPPASPTDATAGLKESSGESTLFLVGDTDWFLDHFGLRRLSGVFGVNAVQPLNDNLFLASNAADFLTGSTDLLSLRGRGNTERTFEVVERLQAQAQQRNQQRLDQVESRLNDLQQKIVERQGKAGEQGRLVITPELQKEIDAFQQEQVAVRAERRQIRKELREDIETLKNRLLLINLLVVPVGLIGFGLWYSRLRRR